MSRTLSMTLALTLVLLACAGPAQSQDQTKFVIQLRENPNYCLGVATAAPGQPVVLSLLAGTGSPTTQWYMDPNSGYITSVAGASQNLVLDFDGTAGGNGKPVIIAAQLLGRQQQRWNWVGSPPQIMNSGAPGYAIDNDSGNLKVGNKIQIWQAQSGNANQQWIITPVPTIDALK